MKTIFIKIVGSSMVGPQYIEAAEHELVGLPADTFHKITLKNGTVLYFNNFGVRSVVIADNREKLD